MRGRCPKCGQALPDLDLPVCAHCGERLPARLVTAASAGPGIPLLGGESREELLQRFFQPAVSYQVPPLWFWAQLLSPLLLPLAALAGGALLPGSDVPWLTPALAAPAFVLIVHVWLTRAPSRTAVTLSTRGLRCGGVYRSWDGLQEVREVPGRAGAVELVLDDGRVFRITREQTRTAAIQSLHNLRAVLEAVLNAAPEAGHR